MFDANIIDQNNNNRQIKEFVWMLQLDKKWTEAEINIQAFLK